jgi:hypothetical protein
MRRFLVCGLRYVLLMAHSRMFLAPDGPHRTCLARLLPFVTCTSLTPNRLAIPNWDRLAPYTIAGCEASIKIMRNRHPSPREVKGSPNPEPHPVPPPFWQDSTSWGDGMGRKKSGSMRAFWDKRYPPRSEPGIWSRPSNTIAQSLDFLVCWFPEEPREVLENLLRVSQPREVTHRVNLRFDTLFIPAIGE